MIVLLIKFVLIININKININKIKKNKKFQKYIISILI